MTYTAHKWHNTEIKKFIFDHDITLSSKGNEGALVEEFLDTLVKSMKKNEVRNCELSLKEVYDTIAELVGNKN